MTKKETKQQKKEREKAYRKESQKIAIQGIGRTTNQTSISNSDSLKKRGKEEIEVASKTIESTATSLQESVKGQFGNKVTEILNQQKSTLQNL